ncbi:MAG TPA: hypothetical protein VFX21_10875 [Acidimicrobiia bacterium]|nr:hypothetical protein [Acidimicrobiia bacterium]
MGTARRRGRVVSVAAIALIAGGLSQMLPASASGAPSRPVDRDIDTYVLFGFESVNFKGAESAGRGIISGGNVGANGIDTDPADSEVVVNICANHNVTMDHRSQLVGDSVRATDGCHVWDVYANSLIGSPAVVPANSGPTAFATPVVTAPAFPSFACNAAAPVDVGTGATSMLPPGTYGAVKFKDGSTVTLGAGTYTMCDLNIGKNVNVTTVTGTVLQIEQTFSVSNETVFGPVCDVPIYVRADGATGDNDVAVNFSKHTSVAGKFFTLLGKIALGNDTDLEGNFWGRRLISDADVNVEGCRPPPATTTTTSGGGATSSSSSSSTATSSSATSTSTTSTSTTTTTTTVPASTTSTTATVVTTTSTTAGASSTTTTQPATTTSLLGTTTSSTAATTTSGPELTVGGVTSSVPLAPGAASSEPTPSLTQGELPRTGGGSEGFPVGIALIVAGLALLGVGQRPQLRRWWPGA